MKIGITAATGRLGLVILDRMIEKVGAENVVAIVRSPEKLAGKGIETRKGDFENLAELTTTCQGLDTVLLISSNSPPQVRLKQHTNVIDAAIATGVRKLVFSGIVTEGKSPGFQPIQQVNLDTEAYLSQCGLQWSAGHNGIYLEPDLEYVETYKQFGKISNCAGNGKCAYTSRGELAIAFEHLLTEDRLNGKTYNLVGEGITQQELTELINEFFHTNLVYEPMSLEAYRQDRIAAMGDLYGNAIAGIYESIQDGDFAPPSDFELVTGRPHQTPRQLIQTFLSSQAKP